MSNTLEKGVAKIFLTNKISATLIIPIGTAKKYDLTESSHVVVEETDKGILIRRAQPLTGNEIFELTHLEKYRQDERKAHFSRRANYALGFYEHCGNFTPSVDYIRKYTGVMTPSNAV